MSSHPCMYAVVEEDEVNDAEYCNRDALPGQDYCTNHLRRVRERDEL